MRHELHAMLATCSTEERLRVFSECIEPSHFGPFGKDYREDDAAEAFAVALEPLLPVYHANYSRLERSVQEYVS